MPNRSLLALLGTLSLILPPVVAASDGPITIAVSPPRFELKLDDGPVSESLRVFNFGTAPAKIRVSVHDWSLNEENRVELLPPTEQSLDQWMIVNPVSFELPAGESQTVRFAVRPKLRPTAGEHRAIIYLSQEPDGATPIGNKQLRVTGKLGVAVYAYAGPIEHRGALHAVTVEPASDGRIARFDISCEGQAHVRLAGHYVVWPVEAYPGDDAAATAPPAADLPLPDGAVAIGYLPHLPVLPGSRRTLPLGIDGHFAPGHYVLEVNGDLSGAPIDRAVHFSVPMHRAGVAP